MLDVTRAYGLSFLIPEGDSAIGSSLRRYGEFARPETDFILAYLRGCEGPGAYLDVGANIGAIALPVATALRQWSVIAVEAHRGLCGVLAANTLNNFLSNVEFINAAVGPTSGLAQFPNASLGSRLNFGTLGMHLSDQLPSENVRMCTIDEIAPANTRFIKIDVEGFEREVLRGAEQTIGNVRPAWLLEANPRAREGTVECMELLANAGYQLFWFAAPFVTPAHRKPADARPALRFDLNFVALPDGAANIWDLPPAGDVHGAWPDRASHFAYLEKYGFKFEGSTSPA